MKHVTRADAVSALKIAKLPSVAGLDYEWGSWKLIYDQPSKVVADVINNEAHLAPNVKKAMDQSKAELLIVPPYFVPGERFTECLVEQVKGGKHVRILTSSSSANDVPLVHAGYMRYRKDLVKGGIDLYEFKAIKCREKEHEDEKEKTRAKWAVSSRAGLHGKYIAFDRRYLFVGLFNLDGCSVALNTELGVLFESTKYAEQLAAAFEQQAMHKAYRIVVTDDDELQWVTPEDGEQMIFDHEPETGFWTRFGVGFMSIFVPASQL